MKLSEVLAYIELLDNKLSQPNFYDASRHLDNVVHLITTYPHQLGNFSQEIHSAAEEVKASFAKVDSVMIDLQQTLEKIKANLERPLFEDSVNLYEQEMVFETNDYILNRKLAIDPEDHEVMYGHLLNYTDWRLPGMIIRPGLEKWIEHLVPLDPLYVVDTNDELVEPAVARFTVEYQRRLRRYTIIDSERTSIFGQLPDAQFGFIFAYNYFNYKPIEIINRYLKELFGKLRPGGVFMFTYNDCDWSHGTALAEKKFMCYTPSRIIEHEAMLVGFEIVYKHRGLGNINWLELKRPGDIVSYRGGQSLAKIVVKP